MGGFYEKIYLCTSCDGWGPHGQEIGQFSSDNGDNKDFKIDYIKVWQNENFEQYIKDDDEFMGEFDLG